MPYNYSAQRASLFTESGVALLLKVRGNVDRLLAYSGAFEACRAWENCSGNSWTMLAALDYLCEQGVIKKVWDKEWAQHAVFARGCGKEGA